MKYLLKLMFDEDDIFNSEFVEGFEFFKEIGIKDLILETNKSIIDDGHISRKSAWVSKIKDNLSNLKNPLSIINRDENIPKIELHGIYPKISRYENKIF